MPPLGFEPTISAGKRPKTARSLGPAWWKGKRNKYVHLPQNLQTPNLTSWPIRPWILSNFKFQQQILIPILSLILPAAYLHTTILSWHFFWSVGCHCTLWSIAWSGTCTAVPIKYSCVDYIFRESMSKRHSMPLQTAINVLIPYI